LKQKTFEYKAFARVLIENNTYAPADPRQIQLHFLMPKALYAAAGTA
jgi:hypothetical protein